MSRPGAIQRGLRSLCAPSRVIPGCVKWRGRPAQLYLIAMFFVAVPVAIWLSTPVSAVAQGFPDIEIIEAAKNGGIADARSAFLNGQSINSRDRDGKPALVVAAEHGNVAVMRFLLEESANPDLRDKRTTRTALLMASELGNVAIVRLLIDAKADLSKTDRQGETALMKAARAGSLDAVRLLIEAGADVNATDYAGHTALWHALDGRQQRAAQMLQEAGGQ